MAYAVTTFDLCVQGFERLRTNSEFICCAYVGEVKSGDYAPAVLEQWLSEIQVCDMGEGFDYDAARAAIEAFVASDADRINRAYASLDWPAEDDVDAEGGCIGFLYVDREA